MNDSEKQVRELKQLLAPTTAEWNDPVRRPALYQQARTLLEALQATPDADQQQVQQLAVRLRRRMGNPDSAPPPALPSQEPVDLPRTLTAFEQALAQINQGASYTDLEKLQEGRFVTGLRATACSTGDPVVIKLPAASAWSTRFEECAAALRTEAAILRTVNTFLPPPNRRACARVITQLGSGDLTLPDWPHPVPYSVQSFARGTRLWRSGLLPMRGDQERAGVLLLAQITGLVQQLYAYNLAHRDLKPDALFWDATDELVEVIDWNSACPPTDADIAREFTLSLTSLVCEVFLGVAEPTSDRHGFSYTLFATERGVGLSRGVRLLLARLLDPTFSANAIRDVAGLHTALTELADAWLDTTREQMPPLTGTSPEQLAALLSTTAIALQQPVAQAGPNQRSDWYSQAMRLAEQEVQKTLTLWLHYPAHLRAGWGRIEHLNGWLPEVWPLVWLVPVARTWFAHEPPTRDDRLTEILYRLVQRHWTALQQLIIVERTAVAAPVQSALDMLDQVARVMLQAAEVETLLSTATPDYTAAFRMLTPLRTALPLDAGLLDLEQRIAAGMTAAKEVLRLRTEITLNRQGTPTRVTQTRILKAQEQLRRLGYPDEQETEQRQLVAHLDAAQKVFNAAAIAARDGNYPQAQQAVAQWHSDAVVKTSAPELAAALAELAAAIDMDPQTAEQMQAYRRAQRQHAQAAQAHQQWQRDRQQIEQQLAAGDFAGAVKAALQTLKLMQQMPETSGQFSAECTRLVQILKALVHLHPLLLRGDYQAAHRIRVPDAPPEAHALTVLISEVQSLVAQGVASQKTTRIKELFAIVRIALENMQDTTLPSVAHPLWRVLRDQTLTRLEQGMLTFLDKESCDQPVLRVCETTIAALIEEVGIETRPNLKYARVLLRYHQERQHHVVLKQQQAEEQQQQYTRIQALAADIATLQAERATIVTQLQTLTRRINQLAHPPASTTTFIPDPPEDHTLEKLLLSPEDFVLSEQKPDGIEPATSNYQEKGNWLTCFIAWLKAKIAIAPVTEDASTPASTRHEEIQ